MYIATHYQQCTVADVDRTECAEDRYGSCCVWCWAMYSGYVMDVICMAW